VTSFYGHQFLFFLRQVSSRLPTAAKTGRPLEAGLVLRVQSLVGVLNSINNNILNAARPAARQGTKEVLERSKELGNAMPEESS
jgi:hypothetical protein